MESLYRKRVLLTEEEIRQYQKELLYFGTMEERHEEELLTIKEHMNADIKMKQADISEAKSERRKYQNYLTAGYRNVEVPSRNFTDQDRRLQLIIEVENLELLETKDVPAYSQADLGFDNYLVVVVDEIEQFDEKVRESPALFTPFNMNTITLDNFPDPANYYIFRNEEDIRVFRFPAEWDTEFIVDHIDEVDLLVADEEPEQMEIEVPEETERRELRGKRRL